MRDLFDLPLHVDGYHLEPLSMQTTGGWERLTTVVHLYGAEQVGVGEDVTYDVEDQRRFHRRNPPLDLRGRYTLAEFSARLDQLPLFEEPPTTPHSQHYRRWAFESAALDLALTQADRTLAEVLGRVRSPLHFVVSLGLGDPPTLAPLQGVLRQVPDMRFKVDLGESWTTQTVESLRALADKIAVVDYKGQYRGSFTGPPADPELYRQVAEALPNAWIEDPAWDAASQEVLAPYHERITWDAILHSVRDIEELPFAPRCINIKPSRFATTAELLRVYSYCAEQDIQMYGGGQFELGPGRDQIQYLAALFHPNAANDTAPGVYNKAPLPDDLPASPLAK